MSDNRDELIKQDYDILKTKFHKLHFLNGVAIYYDKSATSRRIKFGEISGFENNFSLVKDDGAFLISGVFFNKIHINKYGLFVLKIARHHIYPTDRISFDEFTIDKDNNMLMCNFSDFVDLLANRNNCYSTADFSSILDELELSRFKVVEKVSRRWILKEGKFDLDFDQSREDGLIFHNEEFSRGLSDSYTEVHNVSSGYENKISLNDFYLGLKMLQNGQEFLKSTIEYYLEKTIEWQIKE